MSSHDSLELYIFFFPIINHVVILVSSCFLPFSCCVEYQSILEQLSVRVPISVLMTALMWHKNSLEMQRIYNQYFFSTSLTCMYITLHHQILSFKENLWVTFFFFLDVFSSFCFSCHGGTVLSRCACRGLSHHHDIPFEDCFATIFLTEKMWSIIIFLEIMLWTDILIKTSQFVAISPYDCFYLWPH